jgi:hypothetical protein
MAGADWFYENAVPDIKLHHWLQARGVDMMRAIQLAGPICELAILRYPNREFRFAEDDERDAVRGVVHVVSGADAETPIGLVAWCRDRPDDVYQYPTGLPALGLDQLDNPASYFSGRALRVHRMPLDWLASGCDGIVPLDLSALWSALDALPRGTERYVLIAESVQHGHALKTGLQPLPSHVRLVAPRRDIAA